MQSETCEKILKMLRTLNIPSAYSHFNKPPSVPFVVYTIPESRRYGADNLNMLQSSTVRVELYTDHKDIQLENRVADLFREYEIDSYETYISDQQLYQVVFEFEIITKIKKEA